MSSRYKNVEHKTTIGSAVEDAYSALGELRDECQDWYDNLPENFQSGDKGDALQTIVDDLGSYCDNSPDVPDFLKDLPISFFESHKKGGESRSVRCGNAVGALEAVKDMLESEEGLGTVTDDQRDEIVDLIGELDNMIDAGNGVEFPGMFG